MHKISDQKKELVKKCAALFAAVLTILACILPMGELPLWNGEEPGHRNQYELMAEAILDGRIDFAYGDEGELAKLENPYDPVERTQAEVVFHWDHAYYDGHYYMYFGIVPVFLAFLPYRIITGASLTTFHATQLFTAAIIAGIFTLFWMLSRRFFSRLHFGLYLMIAAAFSVMSVWYAAAEPALYCTAITAAIALEVWSLYFFIRAVYVEERENRQIVLAGVGALLGALVFGCRPPVALANVMVLPMLIVFLKEHTLTKKLLGKLALAAMPYLLVAVALMIYNYVRFDDPFEFGQTYQLTVADQTNYSFTIDAEQLLRIREGITEQFCDYQIGEKSFPYVRVNGVFMNFPALLVSIAAIFPTVTISKKHAKLRPLVTGLFIAAIIITVMDVIWTPYLLERYRMDIYFLLGICTYLILGVGYEDSKNSKLLFAMIAGLSVVTVVFSFLLYVRTVGLYYPDKVEDIARYIDIIGMLR